MKRNSESRPASPQAPSSELATPRTLSKSLTERFSDCIYGSSAIDLEKLRKLAWSGIPNELRPMVWKVLIVSVHSDFHSHSFTLGILASKQ